MLENGKMCSDESVLSTFYWGEGGGGRGRGQNAYRMNFSNPRDQDCRSLIARRAYTCLLVQLLHGENQRTRAHTLRN